MMNLRWLRLWPRLSHLATALLVLTMIVGWSGGGLAKGGKVDGRDMHAAESADNYEAEATDDGHGGDVNASDDSSSDGGSDDGEMDNDGESGNDTSDDTRGEVDEGANDDNSGSDSDDDGLDIYDDDVGEGVTVVDDDADETTDGFRAGESIVRLRHTARIDDVNARHGTTTLATIPARNLFLLQLPTDRPEVDAEDELEHDPDIAWAELNYANRAPEGRPGYFFVSGAPSPRPGPSYAADLLGLPPVGACATGAGITVAVLDTGVDTTHPILAQHLRADGWNALTGETDVSDVGNGLDDDGDGLVDEMAAHGTHVAGIVLQTAPGVAILPIRVLDSDGVGDAFFLAAGIFYAVNHGAQVINLSLSSTFDARVVRDAVAVATKAGVIVVAAAGNADRDHPREYPAADRGAIGVAATDIQDHKSDFSNFGANVALSAPGTDIVSAIPGGGYAAWSGTSMAAPFVTGAAALLLARHSGWTPRDVVSRLAATTASLDALNPEYAGELGAGRLDVDAAVACNE